MAKPTLESLSARQNAQFWIGVVVATLLAVGVIVVGVVMHVYNTQNVKFVTGVGPDGGGEVTLIAGLGELIVTDAPNHDITISNTGVVTVNTLNPDAGGNLVIDVVAPGLGITNVGNTITLSNDGVTSLIAGQGIAVDAAVGPVTVSNTGLITANGLAPDGAGDMVFAAGTAMGILSAGNTITFNNLGVLTLNGLSPTLGDVIVTAVDGLGVVAAGNTVTLNDVLTTQTALDNTDASGPLVDYTAFVGFFVPVPEATWRTGLVPGFPSPFIPGTFDDGQGNVGGSFWTVPTTGTYSINVDCEVIPSAIAADDHQSVSIALCFGATSEDPLAAGVIPIGAYATMDISGGTNANVAAPPLDRRLSFSTTFQAGCTNCEVQVAQTLSLHTHLDRTGILPGPYTADFVCRMRVARIK